MMVDEGIPGSREKFETWFHGYLLESDMQYTQG
jgi:hypothetical protein